jgi:hypothetical protein
MEHQTPRGVGQRRRTKIQYCTIALRYTVLYISFSLFSKTKRGELVPHNIALTTRVLFPSWWFAVSGSGYTRRVLVLSFKQLVCCTVPVICMYQAEKGASCSFSIIGSCITRAALHHATVAACMMMVIANQRISKIKTQTLL